MTNKYCFLDWLNKYQVEQALPQLLNAMHELSRKIKKWRENCVPQVSMTEINKVVYQFWEMILAQVKKGMS
jgi:hypothetical protein